MTARTFVAYGPDTLATAAMFLAFLLAFVALFAAPFLIDPTRKDS